MTAPGRCTPGASLSTGPVRFGASGSATRCSRSGAAPGSGWDPVTGLGTLNAAELLPPLVARTS